MKFTTWRALKAAGLASGAAPVSRSRLVAALIPATLAVGLFGHVPDTAAASARSMKVSAREARALQL